MWLDLRLVVQVLKLVTAEVRDAQGPDLLLLVELLEDSPSVDVRSGVKDGFAVSILLGPSVFASLNIK